MSGYTEKVGNVKVRYLQDTKGWFFAVTVANKKSATTGRRFPSFIAARNEAHRLYRRK